MERIAALEQRHRDLLAGFRVNHAQGNGRGLMDEQREFFAMLARGERETVDSEELFAAMQALGSTFGKSVS